ncbi:GGDEF domain-containing protein [Candidatus Thiodiazotropha sp. CDECU1]|uniref:GGDEF domain-containing protein n=1 Tax=Candidatus Thiodiazotropha sp. CDECU1 TaxID=3065865 RepID=UPI00292EA11C|nr:GGDEF domain-containing protein [Candidatus Thiodiazotropha sp. CDECU1]
MLRLPQLIKNSLRSRFRVSDTFPVSLVICLIGFLAHFSFIFLFDYWGVPSLSYFNVFSSLLWAWAIAEILRGYTYRSVYLGTIEILLHAVFAMSILGQDSGFDLYLWPLAAWLAYNPNINHKFALVAGSASIILWVFGRVYWSHVEDVPVSVETLAMMLRVNAVIAGIAFIFGIVSARILVERHSKQLTELARRDELTGLYNRHYLTEYISRHEQQDQPNRRAYALIMTDVDHFKAINDQYGHEIGDIVLQAFALHLQKSVRKEDLVCRWGGEEFIIILPKCSLEEATSKAESIRREIADKSTVDGRVQPIYITASFGVTLNATGEYFSDLISRADKLLYQAKESGRNRVIAK